MTQDELKTQAAQAALHYVVPGEIVGVGTGSTVNRFIDALAAFKGRIAGAVSSSAASTARLQALGIEVLDANAVGELAVYIDGADEIDAHGHMVKGGGGALTREKIVAAQSRRFVCIADASKRVRTLGAFAIAVEVIPMAAARIARTFAALAQPAASGGAARLRDGHAGVQAVLRCGHNGQPWVTDNGQHILDVRGLDIVQPPAFECAVSQWPGVVTVGVFALQKADICLLGTAQGVQTLEFAR